MDKRILAISDIHGCYNKFVNLLEQTKYKPEEDQLILLGDYIDRGSMSYETVQLVKECVAKGAIALLGNHELMAMHSIENGYTAGMWLYNGGQSTIDSYKNNQSKIDNDLEFLKSLPSYHETEEYIFVHAGLDPDEPLPENMYIEDLVWIRDEWLYSDYSGKPCVFGHTPMKNVLVKNNGKQIGIDTGAVYGGKLSCIELPMMKIYQV